LEASPVLRQQADALPVEPVFPLADGSVRPSVQPLADAPQVARDDSLPVSVPALAQAFLPQADLPQDDSAPEHWLALVFQQPDDLVPEFCSAA